MYKEEKIHINEKGNRRIQQKKRSAKRRTWNIAATVAFSALLFGGGGWKAAQAMLWSSI